MICFKKFVSIILIFILFAVSNYIYAFNRTNVIENGILSKLGAAISLYLKNDYKPFLQDSKIHILRNGIINENPFCIITEGYDTCTGFKSILNYVDSCYIDRIEGQSWLNEKYSHYKASLKSFKDNDYIIKLDYYIFNNKLVISIDEYNGLQSEKFLTNHLRKIYYVFNLNSKTKDWDYIGNHIINYSMRQ